jgi:hypothetical protein
MYERIFMKFGVMPLETASNLLFLFTTVCNKKATDAFSYDVIARDDVSTKLDGYHVPPPT